MREIRLSGSEGGGTGNSTGSPYPYPPRPCSSERATPSMGDRHGRWRPLATPDAGAAGAAFPRWSVGTIKKNPRPSWRYSMVRSPRARVIGYCRLWRIAHQGITVIIKEKGRHEQAPGTPQT